LEADEWATSSIDERESRLIGEGRGGGIGMVPGECVVVAMLLASLALFLPLLEGAQGQEQGPFQEPLPGRNSPNRPPEGLLYTLFLHKKNIS